MKPKHEKKLNLGKEIILNFDNLLEPEEQEKIKGGTKTYPQGNTDVPVYCL